MATENQTHKPTVLVPPTANSKQHAVRESLAISIPRHDSQVSSGVDPDPCRRQLWQRQLRLWKFLVSSPSSLLHSQALLSAVASKAHARRANASASLDMCKGSMVLPTFGRTVTFL